MTYLFIVTHFFPSGAGNEGSNGVRMRSKFCAIIGHGPMPLDALPYLGKPASNQGFLPLGSTNSPWPKTKRAAIANEFSSCPHRRRPSKARRVDISWERWL